MSTTTPASSTPPPSEEKGISEIVPAGAEDSHDDESSSPKEKPFENEENAVEEKKMTTATADNEEEGKEEVAEKPNDQLDAEEDKEEVAKKDVSKQIDTDEKIVEDEVRQEAASDTPVNATAVDTTESTPPVLSPSVTSDRKYKLLLEARATRLVWILKVSLPYEENDGKQDALGKFGSSRAALQAPSVSSVLNLLYGNPNVIPQRMESLLEPTTSQDLALAIPSGNELLEAEVAKKKHNSNTVLLMSYQAFVSKLSLPECAMLVQGMRNFCRHLMESNDNDASKLASTLNAYLNATHQTIQSHVAWNNNATKPNDASVLDDKNIRRSLESFIYGHVGSHIAQVLLNSEREIQEANNEWMERLKTLGFVTPHHLELDCFTVSNEQEAATDLLRGPMDALLSVDCYHSPFEKLQQILKVYHGVNVALSAALNESVSGSEEEKEKILPSADHVLPTLILVVLRARAERLVVNLRIVELFCLPEHLRGEAGYAFTNLYGAVQFLRDLKLSDHEEPDALVISANEWRNGLASCRVAAEKKLDVASTASTQPKVDAIKGQPVLSSDISVTEVRAARLSGKDVNLEWALQRQKDQVWDDTSDSKTSKKEDIPFVQQAAAFSRTYSFLTTRPEEVKIADLPQLLAEYRALVHTTEVLLAERTARLASERKSQLAKERRALEANAAAIDPNLV